MGRFLLFLGACLISYQVGACPGGHAEGQSCPHMKANGQHSCPHHKAAKHTDKKKAQEVSAVETTKANEKKN